MKARRLWIVVSSGLLVALSAGRSLAGPCPPPAPPEEVVVDCESVERPPGSPDAPLCRVRETITINGPLRLDGSTRTECPVLWPDPDVLGWPDLWMLLPQTPGVLTSRWSALDRTPPLFAAPGGPPDQSVVLLDGVVVSDAASLAAFLVDPSFTPLGEVLVGADGFASAAAPGVRVDLATARGSNELRASAYSLWAARQSELRRHETSGVEVGGPLERDHLWLVGGWSRQEARWSDSGSLDGQLQERVSLRLDAAAASTSHLTSVSWLRGDAARTLEPAPGTGRDGNGRTDIRLLRHIHIPTPNLFLSATYGEIDRTAEHADSAWQAEGRARDASLVAHLDLSRAGSHGVEIGGRWRRDEESTVFGPVRTEASSESRGLWVQDSWQRDDRWLWFGVRYDGQRLPALGAEAASFSPRGELRWSLGRNRTELRLFAGRFASRLGAAVAAWLRAGGGAVDPDLRPEITDELSLAVRRDLVQGTPLELRATYRRTRHLLESQTAGAGVPRLANGDGREGSLGLTLQGSGYLDAGQTFVRGHLTWLDWDLPRDGGRPAVLSEGLALRSRWSYHLSGTRRLPHALAVSAGVNGREGTLAASDVFTLEARLVRDFMLRGLRLGLILDGFNLTGEEVEEIREPASPLPWNTGADRMLLPRGFRLGVRLEWRGDAARR